MRFVLDASIASCWLFRDEQNHQADAVLVLMHEGAEASVPLLWWFEIRNAALSGLRRKRTSEDEAQRFFGRLQRISMTPAQLLDADAVFTLAHRHRLTFYDATYLELAQREGIALATLDQALARAAAAEGVPLIGA